jgi:predicted NAD/FAD-binding protein
MHGQGLNIAVVGSGITGLSCAWLLGRAHRVTVFEAAHRVGGHSCTVELQRAGGPAAVDIGFIVYNERTYPNLTALFRHLSVPTQPSCMSLGISVDNGAFEYGGHDLASLFAQRRNLVRPRFWAMLSALLRLYRKAPGAQPGESETLGAWLDRNAFPAAFQRDHLLPMAAAIWSCPPDSARAQPAAAFLRFCDNHGLLRLRDRPEWRTVTGGSREYVWRLLADFSGRVETGREIVSISRAADRVTLRDAFGDVRSFDHVVIASHGDEAFSMIADKDAEEQEILGAFHGLENRAVLHGDTALMPRRRAMWSSWNFLATSADPTEPPCVTYWMNRLQNLPQPNLFLTLNPRREPAPGLVFAEHHFTHPVFDTASLAAQKKIWSLQGRRRTFFCGAYLGAGFHEDGLQAGLAVAEAIGGVRRPWSVPGESARLHIPADAMLAVPA